VASLGGLGRAGGFAARESEGATAVRGPAAMQVTPRSIPAGGGAVAMEEGSGRAICMRGAGSVGLLLRNNLGVFGGSLLGNEPTFSGAQYSW